MDFVALYAAGLSTIVGLIQGVTWYCQHHPHVRVTIAQDWAEDTGQGDGYPVVIVTAVNRGSRPVQMVTIGWFEPECPDRLHRLGYAETYSRPPQTVNPWELVHEGCCEDQITELASKPQPKIAGWVELATGEIRRSKPLRL